MNISIIICTYDRARLLDRALQSAAGLLFSKAIQAELLVVDNNSKDDTKQIIDQWAKKIPFRVRYIFELQQGKSFALNHGIEEVKGELICFTDDDVILDKNWAQSFYEASLKQSAAAGFAGNVIAEWPANVPSWIETSGPYVLNAIAPGATVWGSEERFLKEGEATSGCNSAFRKSVFEKGFRFRTDLGYFGKKLIAGEDTKFGASLMRQGHQLAYVPGAIVYHPVEPIRLKKQYIRDRYFKLGETQILMSGKTKYSNYPRIFGVYRFLFRELFEYFSKWFLHLLKGAWASSFYYETRLLVTAGMILYLRKERD